jgi:MFS family permease
VGAAAETPFRYGQLFWLAYLSNALLLVAVALLYRYADFVTLLGGSEYHLGWIVGIGIVGSLVTRLLLGAWIDRHGTRPLWIASALLFAATCFAHLAVASHTGVAIYLLRISYCCAVAGANGASMTFISKCGPKERLAELVGMLGTAGFLGAVIGTLLGDFLLGSVTVARGPVVMMFVIAGLLGLGSLPLAWAATRKERRPRPSGERAGGVPCPAKARSNGAFPMFSLLRRHNPGMVLVVSVAMGMGLGLPPTFLRTHATDLGIPRIGLFFLVYAVAALITRVLTRRWCERFGARRIILLGMASMAASLLLLLPVRHEWEMMLPAVLFGCAQALLFPSVVAAGSVRFPLENRGFATILILAASDLGLLIGSPTAGAVIRYAPLAHLKPYPTLYITMAALVAAVGAWYAYSSRRREPVPAAAEAMGLERGNGPRTFQPRAGERARHSSP